MRVPKEVLHARQALLAQVDQLLGQVFGQLRGVAKDWRKQEEASLAQLLEKAGGKPGGDKK